MKMISQCDFCGKMKEVKRIAEKYVCEECYEKTCLNNAALYGYEWWLEALNFQHEYENNVDRIVAKEIKKITDKFKDVQIQKEKLLEDLEQEITVRLEFYRKDEIFVALLTIKEGIRRSLLMKNSNQDWSVISDASTVNLLMKLTSEICNFENHFMYELEEKCSNFVNAIFYARRYNMIKENIDIMYGKNIQLKDICFEPIPTDETDRYFDLYLKNGLDEKPEDYKIQNKVLLKKLESEYRAFNMWN